MSSFLLPSKPTCAGEVLRKFVIQLHVNNCSDTKLQFTVLVATLYTAYIRSSLYNLPELHLSSGLLAELTNWMMFLLFSNNLGYNITPQV